MRYLSKSKNYSKLSNLLADRGVLDRKKFKDIERRAKTQNQSLTETLLRTVSAPDVDKTLNTLSEFFDLPVILLRNKTISAAVLNLIPKEIAEQYQVVGFKKSQNQIMVATCRPESPAIIDFIAKKTSLEPHFFISPPADISLAIKQYNVSIKNNFWKTVEEGEEKLMSGTELEKMSETVPIIKIINSTISSAVKSSASDIHFEPSEEKVRVRFRIDGILHKITEYPKGLMPLITARIKVMSNLKIDEHILPQDGRFQFVVDDNDLAVRVSIIPTLYGPKIALRLLEMKEKNFTLKKLGLNKNHEQILKDSLRSPCGMILVTGPTGSGKTTTLYTALKILNKESVHICTIEDPIEYGVDNINQIQIKPEVGMTFARGLKALLRQDPNVLMVGEIRDLETAQIAANASMTGHLVLTTLHTNDAFLATQRLLEMGVEPYLVGSVVNLIVGQRLVRRLCPHCRIHVKSADKFIVAPGGQIDLKTTIKKLRAHKLLPSNWRIDQAKLYRARGCKKCNYTGYKGRLGIYEIISLDDKLRQFITHQHSGKSLRSELASTVITMAEDGVLKVLNGVTTIEEVLRVTKE